MKSKLLIISTPKNGNLLKDIYDKYKNIESGVASYNRPSYYLEKWRKMIKENEVKRKTDFSKLPIGTKVWNFIDGAGYISNIKLSNDYPIMITFENGDQNTYHIDGREDKDDINPLLFLQKFEVPDIAFEVPKPDLKIDDKIMVRLVNGEWYFRHFKMWDGEKVVAWDYGRDSFTAESVDDISWWSHYRLPTEEELNN